MKSILIMMLFASFAVSAQTPDDLATAACRKHSTSAPAPDPMKALQAQEADFQKCLVMNIPSAQRREIALHREKAAICNEEANIEQKRESMPKAERDKVYAKCMAPRYIVQ